MQEEIKKALNVLYKGGLILYPTDTIWGIGCDATNEEAVKRIYEIKKREDSKSMLVLLDDATRIPFYVDEMPEIAWDLIEVADKPLTIIYPNAKNFAKNLIANDKSIGIRIVNDKFCNDLIRKFKKPIVSTSANFSGEKSPSIFSEITEEIKKSVDYIVNHKQNETKKSQASQIIKLGIGGEIKIIRK
ncbi:MAG: threonylcarbamoyl-AMP synthase [Bacteroidales bacterium]|nr:threonylcarbamoyl-AMP synthase [Bacteroidales bacterium]MBN2755723.1 threonylcarbamoyl-AMP synthase [Bacteroidales bacterium]